MLSGDNILNIDKITAMNVHKVHVFLAHRLDKQNMEALLRRGPNVTQL